MVVLASDPKCQPGAYFALGAHLYYVTESDDTSVVVENCKTGYQVRLAVTNLEQARLIQSTPAVPDVIPDGE